MRLNSNTFPAYMLMEENRFELLQIDAVFGKSIFKSTEDFKDFILGIKHTFKQVHSKYYVTEPFKEAIVAAAPKILKDKKLFTDIPSDCGILFTPNGFNLYISNPTDKKLKLLCYGFTRDTLTTYGIIDNDFNFIGAAFNNKEENELDFVANWLNGILLTIWFIKNCEIETKVLAPKEKYRHEGTKYFNESKSNIKILNCNWFTDLIRNIPFNVKGHFRWQPHGEKNSKRKLIWIQEFEKKGYFKKSQKEKSLHNILTQ
jgi:hypothetical protein